MGAVSGGSVARRGARDDELEDDGDEREGDMKKKKTTKSKAARSMKNLPAKTINARSAKSVKGGGSTKGTQPTENLSLNYGKIHYDY
jgi:hypothetical protein